MNALLRKYNHVFSWHHEQTPNMEPEVTCHKLDINPNTKPVKQKLRWINLYWWAQVQAEVYKILAVNFIEGVKYPI